MRPRKLREHAVVIATHWMAFREATPNDDSLIIATPWMALCRQLCDPAVVAATLWMADALLRMDYLLS